MPDQVADYAPDLVAAGPALAGEEPGGTKRERRNIGTYIAVSLVAVLIAVALLVPVLPLQDPILPDYDNIAAAPNAAHLLGTDLHGRDELSRLLWASRTSLMVGIAATSIALLAGMLTGALAAIGGRYTDSFTMRTADVFLSFPVILGAMAIMAILGPGSINVFIAIAFFGWPVFTRLFRSSILSTRERKYVSASRIMGAGETRIFFLHILPNSITPLVTYGALAVGGAILAEAGLSFINLGVQRPNPSWGLMLSESMGLLGQAPWLVLAPGLALTLTVLIFILLGESAAGRLDPGNEGM